MQIRIINANDIVTRVPTPKFDGGYGNAGLAVNYSYSGKSKQGEPSGFTRWCNWLHSVAESFTSWSTIIHDYKHITPTRDDFKVDGHGNQIIQDKLNYGLTKYTIENDDHVTLSKGLGPQVRSANTREVDLPADRKSRMNALGAIPKLFGAVSYLLVDHFPSEYIAHITKSKDQHKKA